MCGMCLPHCPTFRRTGSEAESPRGRIALAQALARGQLQADDSLAAHFDHCLSCRACEAMCPSEVRYASILGGARRLIATQRGLGKVARLTTDALANPVFLRTAVRLGASPAAALVGPLSTMAQRLSALARARPRRTAAQAPTLAPASAPRVGLFLGCTGEALDQEALAAAAHVLPLLGFAVETPARQGCCGALHHARGDRAGFEQRALHNLVAFETEHLEAVISVASGCAAMLAEYGQWLATPGAADFGRKVREITDFIAAQDLARLPSAAPLAEPVALHVPCSQAHALRRPDAAATVLAHIPGLRLVTLPDNRTCCGAAGLHMLHDPDTADALREPKLDALAASGARYLVTTNVGCAMHLAAGAKARGYAVEVVHPVSLLARQLALAAGAH